jgi:hypothetical protein
MHVVFGLLFLNCISCIVENFRGDFQSCRENTALPTQSVTMLWNAVTPVFSVASPKRDVLCDKPSSLAASAVTL